MLNSVTRPTEYRLCGEVSWVRPHVDLESGEERLMCLVMELNHQDHT